MNVSIEREREYHGFIVRMNGDIDHHSSEIVRSSIDNELMLQKCKNIIFDFSGVNFMDSSGIGMIIGRYKRAAAVNGLVAAVGVGGTLKKLFELSGINKIVYICDNLEDAFLYIKESEKNA